MQVDKDEMEFLGATSQDTII